MKIIEVSQKYGSGWTTYIFDDKAEITITKEGRTPVTSRAVTPGKPTPTLEEYKQVIKQYQEDNQ